MHGLSWICEKCKRQFSRPSEKEGIFVKEAQKKIREKKDDIKQIEKYLQKKINIYKKLEKEEYNKFNRFEIMDI